MRFRLFSFLLPLLLPAANLVAHSLPEYLKADESVSAESLRVSNNHPFPIREPVQFLIPSELADGKNLLAVSHSVSGGTVEAHYLPVQVLKTNGETAVAWIDVQLRSGESRVYRFQDVGGGSTQADRAAITENFPNGLPAQIRVNEKLTVDLFDLALVEIAGGLTEFGSSVPAVVEEALAEPVEIQAELADEVSGPVKNSFVYTGVVTGENEYKITIRYHLFSSGLIDVELAVDPAKVLTERVYLAVSKKMPVKDPGALATESPHFVAWDHSENEQVTLLTLPSIKPVQKSESAFNRELIRERIITTADGAFALTEIVGPNESLPSSDSSFNLHYRLLLPKERSLAEMHQSFAAFAGFQGRQLDDENFHVAFGSAHTAFGFDYSPAALSVESIRRDFRIANALGLRFVRIEQNQIGHENSSHLTAACHESGIGIHLVGAETPEEAENSVAKLGDAIAILELPLDLSQDAVQAWKSAIDRIQNNHPNIQFAAASSQDAFPAIPQLQSNGIDVAAITQAISTDPEVASVESIRDAALKLGGYTTRNGKTPIITLSAFKPDRSESELQQVQTWYRSLNAILANGSVALLHQGPLVPAPVSLSENRSSFATPLYLDRTPNLQASALKMLIDEYSKSNSSLPVRIDQQPVRLRSGETTPLSVNVRNLTNRQIEVRLKPHFPAEITTESDPKTIPLGPRQQETFSRLLRTEENLAPGFYHLFEEAQVDENVYFGWLALSHRARPEIDLTSPSPADVHYANGFAALEDINPANIRQVIYGTEAPAAETAAASRLQQIVRMATGAHVQLRSYQHATEQERSRSLLLIGTLESNTALSEVADRLPRNPEDLLPGQGIVMQIEHPENPNRFVLIVTGKDSEGVVKAANDFAARLLPEQSETGNLD